MLFMSRLLDNTVTVRKKALLAAYTLCSSSPSSAAPASPGLLHTISSVLCPPLFALLAAPPESALASGECKEVMIVFIDVQQHGHVMTKPSGAYSAIKSSPVLLRHSMNMSALMAVDTLYATHVRFLFVEQAAAQAIAAIIERMPSEQAALPAMLRQGAVFGVESAALLKALASTGLRITDEEWDSILTSCPPSEVQAYQQHHI